MRRECRERFPRHRGLAIPTCITARASRTCRDACQDRLLRVPFEVSGGENFPGIPGACAIRNSTYLARGPWAINFVFIWKLRCFLTRATKYSQLYNQIPNLTIAGFLVVSNYARVSVNVSIVTQYIFYRKVLRLKTTSKKHAPDPTRLLTMFERILLALKLAIPNLLQQKCQPEKKGNLRKLPEQFSNDATR